MTLPADYLNYPNRKRGQDIDRYAMRYTPARRKKAIKGNAALALAVIVPLEFFMLNPSGKPFKHPGAMATPYPDLRHFTTRDYGNRVGAFRLLTVFKKAGVTASFAVNAVLLQRVRPLIDAIIEDGHEIVAHGWDTDSILWGDIEKDVEKRYVGETRDAFEKAGLHPRAWMSPARQQSFATPDLIREAGFDICLDWESDSVPWPINTAYGPLHAFPVSNELDDRAILQTKRQTESEWCEQILEAADAMVAEAPTYGAQALGITMTPYIAAQPFRIWAVRKILAAISENKSVVTGGVSSIVDLFADGN